MCGLGPHGHEFEGALTAPVQTSSTTRADDSASIPLQRDRQEQGEAISVDETLIGRAVTLQRALLVLVFDNPGTLCYANNALATMLWAVMGRSAFQPADWGSLETAFCELLQSAEGTLFSSMLLTGFVNSLPIGRKAMDRQIVRSSHVCCCVRWPLVLPTITGSVECSKMDKSFHTTMVMLFNRSHCRLIEACSHMTK